MARTQSRRSVSVSHELYDGLARLRERHRISNSQLVAQALWALIRGAIQIAPPRSPYLLGLETYALRAMLAEAKERSAWEAAGPRDGTCAICSEHDLVAPTVLEVGGPEYLICWPCSKPAEQQPRDKRRRARA